MLTVLKQAVDKCMTAIVSFIKKVVILATFLSFAVLFGLFFYYLYKDLPVHSLVCLAGIYIFIHLNKNL